MRKDDTPMWDDPNESAFVRELLRSGRQNPVAYDVERGLAEHLARIATGAAAPPWAEAGAVAKTAMPAWVGYVVLPLAAAGIAGLAWVFTGQPATPKASEPPSAAAVATVGAPALELERQREHARVENPASATGSAPSAAAPSGDRVARVTTPTTATQSEPSSRGVRAARAHGRAGRALGTGSDSVTSSAPASAAASGQGSSANTASAGGVDSTAATGALAAPQPEAAERREPDEQAAPRPARDAAQAKAESAPLVDESRLEREMQMLAVTQRVLASNPARALRLSQQGEREFPNTMFSAERRQLGLLALVKLGRLDEARRVGQPFLEKYPNAPWSERLRRALASGVVE